VFRFRKMVGISLFVWNKGWMRKDMRVPGRCDQGDEGRGMSCMLRRMHIEDDNNARRYHEQHARKTGIRMAKNQVCKNIFFLFLSSLAVYKKEVTSNRSCQIPS
jgi:hypothetical protein